jgi:hypothetical protein
MAEVRKIAKYTLDVLLVAVPLMVVIYFLAYPRQIQRVPELDGRAIMTKPAIAASRARLDHAVAR